MAASSSRAKAAEPHAPPPLLTPTDQENLRALWGKMFEEAEENGRTVIIKLFTDYPETKQYFRTIPTEGALYTSPLVAFHGRRVMATINQVFENLDNWRQTCKLLECLVDRHKNAHQVPLRMFQVMFRTLLSVCQDLMVNEFTDDMLVSWDKFIGAVYEEIATAYARTHLS